MSKIRIRNNQLRPWKYSRKIIGNEPHKHRRICAKKPKNFQVKPKKKTNLSIQHPIKDKLEVNRRDVIRGNQKASQIIVKERERLGIKDDSYSVEPCPGLVAGAKLTPGDEILVNVGPNSEVIPILPDNAPVEFMPDEEAQIALGGGARTGGPRRRFTSVKVDFEGFDLDEFAFGWSCEMKLKPHKRPNKGPNFTEAQWKQIKIRTEQRKCEYKAMKEGREQALATRVHHCYLLLNGDEVIVRDRVAELACDYLKWFTRFLKEA